MATFIFNSRNLSTKWSRYANFLYSKYPRGITQFIKYIEKWVLIELGNQNDEINPNEHLAWRNQAASHTDCFLKYREAAEFIIVADIDDILFPQLGKRYLDEFRHLSLQYPFAAGFTYNRTHLKVSAHKSPKDFSLPKYLSSLKQTNEWGSGKSVVIPSRVQTVWLHWPIIIEKGYKMINVPNQQNIMLHFTKWNMLNSTFKNELSESDTVITKNEDDAIVDKIIQSINSTNLKINAEKFLSEINAMQIYESLPTNIIYYPLIEKCYFDIFYSKSSNHRLQNVKAYNPESCPGPIKCQLPTFPGISCIVSKRKYLHKFISENLQIHYPSKKDIFQKSDNGCTM
uniref:Glycosyltransferase family 92 protein n=1 Tax=Panagrolaimus superbus TaxID=310955 RepID=A0A914YLF7_9BILA